MTTTNLTPASMRRELNELADAHPFVRRNPSKIDELAHLMKPHLGESGGPSFYDPRHFPNETPTQNDHDTLQFFLILEALMFTIWRRTENKGVEAWDITIEGQRYIGARGLAASLMRAIRRGPNLLDATIMAELTLPEMEDIYRDEETGQTTLQMLPERHRTLNEVGRILLERYEGQAVNLFEETGGYLFRDDGSGLIQQLNNHFPYSFGDWPFMKLAFLLATALETRLDFDLPTTDTYRRVTKIRDPETFMGMADYYIPFFYARVGVFEIDDTFRQILANRTEIPRESDMEKNFRANQLLAMEEIGIQMGDRNLIDPVDYESWRTGYLRCRPCYPGATDEDVPCPYRPDCLAFQHRPELMDIAWPLVLTTTY